MNLPEARVAQRNDPVHHLREPIGLSRIDFLKYEHIRVYGPNDARKTYVTSALRRKDRTEFDVPGHKPELELTGVLPLEKTRRRSIVWLGASRQANQGDDSD